MGKVSSDYNHAVIHPTIAAQWHPTRNGILTPRSITVIDRPYGAIRWSP